MYYESDYLAHWKYIRKYRTSGGDWRYVYADKDTHWKIDNEIIKTGAWRGKLQADKKEAQDMLVKQKVDPNSRDSQKEFFKKYREGQQQIEVDKRWLNYQTSVADYTMNKNSIKNQLNLKKYRAIGITKHEIKAGKKFIEKVKSVPYKEIAKNIKDYARLGIANAKASYHEKKAEKAVSNGNYSEAMKYGAKVLEDYKNVPLEYLIYSNIK